MILDHTKNTTEKGITYACLGFSGWKHPYVKAFLKSPNARFRFFSFFYCNERAINWAIRNNASLVIWASKIFDEELKKKCVNAKIPLIRMEDGFLRSVGLGVDFQWPYSLVLDRLGIYYDPSMPSDLEMILNKIVMNSEHDILCSRAQRLRNFIVQKGITKYNLSGNSISRSSWPKNKRIILVPGQVEDDASVQKGGCGIYSNLELLKIVRMYEPEAIILYKPHPDVEKKKRKGAISDEIILKFSDEIIRNVRMDSILSVVDEVHTLTSLTGFEALLRGVKVCTYGVPFYSGWGLTDDRATNREYFARRTAKLSLNELIAGTLLLYPKYYDWHTENFCTAEDVCLRLFQRDGQPQGKKLTYICNSIEKLKYIFLKFCKNL